MQDSYAFCMGLHVKLHTPVPLSGVSDVMAIFSNGRHCLTFHGAAFFV